MIRNKLIAGGILLFILGSFFGYILAQGTIAQAPAGSGAITQPNGVSVMLDYGNGMVRTYGDLAVSETSTVLDVTQALADREKLAIKTKDYGDMGLLVEQIGQKKNGDEGKYWQYWVGNVAIQVAASAYKPKAGDVIEWKFLNYK